MTIKEMADVIIRNERNMTFPLKHEAAGIILDSKGNRILDIRGWGRMQYHSAGPEEAAKLQDEFADWVVKTLNEEYDRTVNK